MFYYIQSIEQVVGEEENTYDEYGKMEKVATYEAALSKYYKKLSDVAADLGKNHTYMNIQILSSVGTSMKSDFIGEYKA